MRSLSLLSTLLVATVLLSGQEAKKKKQRPSPPAETSVTLDGKNISIKYSSPSMRSRKIFGDLVPFGKVWRAGANEATAFHTDAALDLNGLAVPAGDYTLFVLPEANSWMLIVNKQTGQWGLTYNEDQDLGRTKMTLSKSAEPLEAYRMTLSATGPKAGKLVLEWESTVATIPFKLK